MQRSASAAGGGAAVPAAPLRPVPRWADPDVDDVGQRPAARPAPAPCPWPSRSLADAAQLERGPGHPAQLGARPRPGPGCPRTRTGRMAGVSPARPPRAPSRRAASRSPPSPLPVMLNTRSTQSRTGAPGSGAGRPRPARPARRAARGSPAPVTALTASASTSPRLVAAIIGRGLGQRGAGIGQVGAGDDEQAVPDAQRVEHGQVLGRLRHPALVGRHHEQHGRDRADAGQHVRDERSCPGTSTKASCSPDGRVSQAKPRSMVRPRRRSSSQRSGSIPVSARTSVDLP